MSNWFFDRVRAALCLGVVIWPLLIAGQTTSPPPQYPANRYLLVVETSHSMQRRAEQLNQTVRDLLGSSLAVQARRGDTLGIWTFNEEVYTGLLPLQQWSPETQQTISQRVVGFVSAQKFEKHGRLSKVMPMLDRVVRGSPFITVILVCFGEEDIHGTPFDARINEFFRVWHLQQQGAGTPFVIAFRGQNGRLVDCTMNPSPWAAELPALPKELFIPLPAPPRPLAKDTSSRPATSSVPPLILSGKKKEPAAEVKAPAALETKTEAVASATNLNTSPPIASSPATVDKSQSAASNLPTRPAATAPSLNAVADSAPSVSTPAAQAPPGNVSGGVGQSGAGASELKPAPKSGETGASKPVAAAPNSSDAKTSSSVSDSTSQPVNPNGTAADRSEPEIAKPVTPSGVEVATAASPSGRESRAIIYWVGALAFFAAASAVWIWRRGSRSAAETSLITESIDRDKK